MSQESTNIQFPKLPDKVVTVEIIGGGDADGLYLDTQTSPLVIQQVQSMYVLTQGGTIGCTMVGISVTNYQRLVHGEKLGPHQFGGQPHYYTIVDRLEDDNQLLLRAHYTAGRTESATKDDGSTPSLGWANTALRKFMHAQYEKLDANTNFAFWIAQDIREGAATAVERFVIEHGCNGASLDEKCKSIINKMPERYKVQAEYSIHDDLVIFRPKPLA